MSNYTKEWWAHLVRWLAQTKHWQPCKFKAIQQDIHWDLNYRKDKLCF